MTRRYRCTPGRSRTTRRSSLALTALHLLIIPARVHASECAAPQHELRRAPSDYLAAFPNTGTLWLTDEEAGDFTSGECIFRATSDSSATPAVAALHPVATPEPSDNVSEAGCGNPGTRLSLRVLEIAPSVPLEVGEEYAVVCGSDEVLYPRVTAAPPPVPEHIDVSVRDIRRIEACGGAEYLRIDLAPISESFFASGGLLLVEYGEDAVDIIRGLEGHAGFGAAYIDLPLSSQHTLTLRAVDALGVEFDSVVVDVGGIGRDPEEPACGIGRRPPPHAGWLLLACVALLVGGRRPGRASVASSGTPP